MSTPIEIVREYIGNRVHVGIGTDEQNTALASVLRDAERFKALERAHALRPRGSAWCHSYDNLDDIGTLWGPSDDTLAELADRLREENK